MSQAIPLPHALAQQVLAVETAHGTPAEPPGQAAVRTYAQLRDSFARFAGVAGFRSILARALTLAQRDAPWLAAVTVADDGALAGFGEAAMAQDPAAARAGGQALLTHFLGLLHIFVGEALTRRLLADAWPDAPFGPPPPARQENAR
jgi:hypothetical protein